MRFSHLAALALLALSPGCGAPAPGPIDRPQAEVRTAISGLAADFEGARAEAFFARFDGAFSGFDVYRARAREFMLRNKQISLNIVVDAVDNNGSMSSARVHWNRSYVDPAGTHKLESGEAGLIFRHKPSGEWLLAGMHGDSPF